MAQFKQTITTSLNWSYTPVYVADTLDNTVYICTFSAPQTSAASTPRFNTSTIPEGSTLMMATISGTVSFSRSSGGTWGSSFAGSHLTIGGTSVSSNSFSVNAYGLLSGMSGGNWWNLGVTCAGGTRSKEYSKSFNWTLPSPPLMPNVWSSSEVSSMTAELGKPGVAQSGTITVTMTLSVHYAEKVARNIFYGIDGVWKNVKAHYCKRGTKLWQEVALKYGAGGTWMGDPTPVEPEEPDTPDIPDTPTAVDDYYFYDNGTQNAHTWRVSNSGVDKDTTSAAVKLVYLQPYQWYIKGQVNFVDGAGNSSLNVRSTQSGIGKYWGEVQSATNWTVTSDYKYLNVRLRRYGANQETHGVFFGLFYAGGSSTSAHDPNGYGVINSTALTLTSTSSSNYSIAIPADLIGKACHFNIAMYIDKPTAANQGCCCHAVWVSSTLPSGSTLLDSSMNL